VDPVRGSHVARVFALYARGDYSIKTITKKAYEIGLRHPRADRRMTKSEIHRMLQRLIYTGDFEWLGKQYRGSHEPLITHEVFKQVQADDIAKAIRATDDDAEQRCCESLRQVEQQRRTVVSKLDCGYEDFVSGRISEEFWARKSKEWEAELQAVDIERSRLELPRPLATTTAERILELAKRPNFSTNRPNRPNSVDCSKRCFRTARSIAELSARPTVSHSTCSSAGTKQEIGEEIG
jgi:Recombinase